jgi:hypothetical protein
MKTVSVALTASLALTAQVGCGSGNGSGVGAPSTFACNQPFGPDAGVIPLCIQYVSVSASDAESYRQLCSGAGGTIVASCPTANRVGCCTMTSSRTEVATCYYAPADPTLQRQGCTANGGVWSNM